MPDRCHGVIMFEAPYKNKGLVKLWFLQYFNLLIKPNECQVFWSVGSMSSTLKPNLKMSQIGIRWFGTKKCSQRYEINHFWWGFFSAIQPSEIPPEILLEIPSGIPLELSLEIHLEIPPEISPGIPLELSLEIHLEIPREIPPEIRLEIRLEIRHHSKTHAQNSFSSLSLVI